MGLLDSLIYLTKSTTVRKLSGKPKRLYKYAIAATFFNIVKGKHLQVGQFQNMEIARDILENPKISIQKYSLDSFEKMVHDCFRLGHFHNPDDSKTVDIVFAFFREKLEALKRGKRFWPGNEFEKIISLNDFFKISFGPIKEHHWIDFNLEMGLIPTIPDFITYSDLINSWNLLLERREEYDNLFKEHKSVVSQLDFKKSEKGREIEYEIFSLQRICYTACVTFVESYLYYLYFNFKSIKLFDDDTEILALYKLNDKKVDDTHIIEKIVIPKFIQDNKEYKKKMETLYGKYENINRTRNSIIHTTAFEDKSNQSSFMELFFKIDLRKVQDAMTNSMNLVLFIEELLPEEHKLLHWWDRFETPDFSLKKKISLINPKSNLSKLSSI